MMHTCSSIGNGTASNKNNKIKIQNNSNYNKTNKRTVLALLEQLGEANTSAEELLGGSVQVGAELGKGGDLAVLGELELHGAGDLLHGLGLSGGADARHRQADVDGRSDALVEQLGLQEDLTVRDRDHVGRNIGGHVARLGLDDGQSGERAAAERLVHLGRALQQAAVQVEHVARVGLATWRTTQQQAHLTVGHRLFGQVVEDDERVLAVVAEVLAHGAARVGRQVLERRGVRGRRRHDDRVLHGVGVGETLDELSDGGALLADGHVNAVELLLLVVALVEALLVDDGVDGDGRLARLTIADDELALTATNGHQAVDGLDARLHRLAHGRARHDAGRLDADTRALRRLERALAVDRVAESVDDATQQLGSDRHVHDGARALDDIALANKLIVTEHDHTDVVRLQIERHTLNNNNNNNNNKMTFLSAVSLGIFVVVVCMMNVP